MFVYVSDHLISRVTCPEIAILFTSFFQVVHFFFADSRRNRAFSQLKALDSAQVSKKKKKDLSKRTCRKNRYFGTCQPAISVLF